MKKLLISLTIICFCATALMVFADGGLGEPCINDADCEPGLTCVDNVCVIISTVTHPCTDDIDIREPMYNFRSVRQCDPCEYILCWDHGVENQLCLGFY